MKNGRPLIKSKRSRRLRGGGRIRGMSSLFGTRKNKIHPIESIEMVGEKINLKPRSKSHSPTKLQLVGSKFAPTELSSLANLMKAHKIVFRKEKNTLKT